MSWIRGDIDADYHGPARVPGSEVLPLTLVRAVVSGPVRVDGPPESSDDELRQAEVTGWLLLDGAYHPATLLDVRVQEWERQVAVERDPERDVVGRLRGRVWARLVPPERPPEGPPRKGTPTPPEPPTTPDPPPPRPPPIPPDPELRDPGPPGLPAGGAIGCVAVGFGLLFGLFAFGAIWLSCGLWLALAWLACALAPPLLRPLLSVFTSRLHRLVRLSIGLVLVVSAVLVAYLALQRYGVAPCDPRSAWWLAAMALPVLLSAFLPERWPATGTVFALTVGLVVWCARPEDCSTGATPTGGQEATLQALEQTATHLRSSYEETTAADDDAQLIAESTDSLSVDDALQDPDAFFDRCGRPVVLSADILFDLDADHLQRASAPHLRKLRRLLTLRDDSRVVVRGHADRTGTVAHNQELSERRARTVANWLVENNALSADRVQTVGLGSTEPVVLDRHHEYLNRRVEVVLACD